jgi:hypothetical protein
LVSNPNKNSNFHFKLILILFPVAFASSCVIGRFHEYRKSLGKSEITFQRAPAVLKFSFDKFIFIKAELNKSESERQFMVDIGSPCTFCGVTKREFGLNAKILYDIGGLKIEYGSCDAQIGPIKYKQLAYLVSEMAFCWKKNNAGYIGANAMQGSIWEFNFRDTTITVSDSLTHFSNIQGAYQVKFKPLGKQATPVLKIAINNLDTVSALLDTGNDRFVQLNSKFDIKGIEKASPSCIRKSYYNINQMGEHVPRDSIVETNYIKTSSVRIGDLELKSATVDHIPLYKGKNLLGLRLFTNFIVTVDWIHYLIYLKPIEKQTDLQAKFTFGFKCDLIGKKVTVGEIFRSSAVDSVGIKSGEEIVSINNISVTELNRKIFDEINSDQPNDSEITVEFKTAKIRLKKYQVFK